MAWIDVTPIVPNTTMQDSETTGSHKITPVSGYVMHNKGRDTIEYDSNGNIISKTLGFTDAPTTCPATYDFTTSSLTLDDGTIVTVYGEKEYFTVLETDVPDNGVIYSIGNNTVTE